MALAAASSLLAELRTCDEREQAPFTRSFGLLAQLKVALTKLDSLGAHRGAPNMTEVAVACEAFERGALLCLRLGDLRGFERHVRQVKPLYSDYAAVLAPSPMAYPVIGLHLMKLLVDSKVADFHCELELLSDAARASPYVAFPIQVEAKLMEGSYNVVLALRSELPHPLYAHFMEPLVSTVRSKVAACSEVAYASLPVAAAMKMMMFESPEALAAFAAAERPTWTFAGGLLHFTPPGKATERVDATTLMQKTIGYAAELERIV